MSPVTIAEDTEPLITAQFSSELDSPRVSGFYDVLENSTDNPDREASMDLAGGGDSLPSASKLYHPPEVDGSEELAGNYITCQICQTTISIKSLRGRVVKCPRCQEGNPIKEPPPGKKYIRCACNCLLVCNATARAVICPRQGCHHRTQLVSPLPKPQLLKEDQEPTISCPACFANIKVSAIANKQYVPCIRCKVRITTLSKSERSLLLLRYLGFFVILALLLTTGILILKLVPGKIWEPMLFCGIAFGVGFPCLIYKFIPLFKSHTYR